MRVGVVFTTLGGVLLVLWAAYVGWRLGTFPVIAWELFGREGMVTWGTIGFVLAYGLAFLVPGSVLLCLGIRRLRKRVENV